MAAWLWEVGQGDAASDDISDGSGRKAVSLKAKQVQCFALPFTHWVVLGKPLTFRKQFFIRTMG